MILSDDLTGYKSSGGILLPPPLKTHTGCLLKFTQKSAVQASRLAMLLCMTETCRPIRFLNSCRRLRPPLLGFHVLQKPDLTAIHDRARL